MIQRTLFVFLLILSFGFHLFAQNTSFIYIQGDQSLEYSNFKKIEREMRRAVKEKKDKIVAIYHLEISRPEFHKGIKIEKKEKFVFILLHVIKPFEILNRVDFINIGKKIVDAPQGTFFPLLYFTEKEFEEIEDKAEMKGFENRNFGKVDKKMIDKFPIVKAKPKRGF
jgi:hypothetical protein